MLLQCYNRRRNSTPVLREDLTLTTFSRASALYLYSNCKCLKSSRVLPVLCVLWAVMFFSMLLPGRRQAPRDPIDSSHMAVAEMAYADNGDNTRS